MKQISIALLFLSLLACKKGKNPEPVLSPEKVTLVSPAANEACTEGRKISENTTAVTLKWNAASNADLYELNLKNLLTGAVTKQGTTSTSLEVTLAGNTPYSWYVVSKSNASTDVAVSESWKFYNAGEAHVSYAPFPAENLIPTMKQNITATNGKVNLSWTSTDVDGDIATYEVLLGTSSSTLQSIQSGIPTNKLDGVAVSSNTTLYWKVIAIDSRGNRSESELHMFTVN